MGLFAGKEQTNSNSQEPSIGSSGSQSQAYAPAIPPPSFHIFKFKTDGQTTYVVPVDTSDDQLKSLLWLFRSSVRTANFQKIGITQPTTRQWGQLGYTSGDLVVYRGTKCANEGYITEAELEKGKLGPCGYGEHDDAYYQWGIDADPNKDDAGIVDKNGNTIAVFDYKDNWHPAAEALAVDPKVKEHWDATEQEWEQMQRFAVQITNQFTAKGLEVSASANRKDPTQLDFQAHFKNGSAREEFVKKFVPMLSHDLCAAGLKSTAIVEDSDSEAGPSYSLHCQ